MEFPENLHYTESHEWCALDDAEARVGLTDYAQKELGDVVFVNLPEEGDELEVGEPFAEVESVKAVSEVMSPVSGTVAEVNEELFDNPALINEDPYGAWFVRVEGAELGEAMDAAAYQAICE